MYLKLKFENATIFPKPEKGNKYLNQFKNTDKSLKVGKFKSEDIIRFDREDIPFYREYITINHISNVIHVLFGERPVPKNRTTIYSLIDKYFIKAQESYLRINTDKLDNDNYISEFIQTRKPFHDSWNPNLYINWLIIEKYLGDTLYNEFIVILKLYKIDYQINLSDSLENIRIIFKDNRDDVIIVDFIDNLRKNKKTPMINYLILDKTGKYLNQFSMSKEINSTVNNGISKCVILSGDIIIPVDKKDIEIIKNNKGCATILDGGIVSISNIIYQHNFNENRLLEEGYRRVSEISTETY